MKSYKPLFFLIALLLLSLESKSQKLKGVIPSMGGNNQEYIIQSPSIRYTLSEIPYWDSIQIVANNKSLNRKELYLEDGDFYFVYDSLESQEYEIRHLSAFKDVHRYTIKLESDTLLRYPKKKLEYNSKELELSDLSKILKSDTLKLVVYEMGCYSFEEQYFEIIKIKTNQKIHTSLPHQIHLSHSNFESRLTKLITQKLQTTDCPSHTCSDIYSLKTGNNEVYKFYGCCESEAFIEKLKSND